MPSLRLANCRLYGFVDTAYLAGRDPGEVTRQLIAGGVDIVQVRAKELNHEQRVALARAVLSSAYPARVPVIINDDIEAAVAVGADGVHLGQEDWAALPEAERHSLRDRVPLFGLSTHSFDEARRAEQAGASYIGVGPVFPTATKPGRPGVGLGLVTAVARAVTIPFFAIGGINLHNLPAVLAAGATRVAVVSAILCASDITAAARAFRDHLNFPSQGGSKP
ncbi:MAG: thiamine phosphate synthase [Verrucomicrobiae bacterium]|nr:thiamine phosphate synthase [Verrucomicrobiae bacterium]